ncbi:MAG: hypothetical protein AAF489_13425 [Bacteroidota bacterium]
MTAPKKIKVFVASSKELTDDRKESVFVITELKKKYTQFTIEPILFELDSSSGNNPGFLRIQDKINPLLDDSEIVIVLFYSKIGTFTQEEIERAISKNKKVFVYLKKDFIPSNSEESIELAKLFKFIEHIDNLGSIRLQEYEKTTDFNGYLYKDLGKYLDEVLKKLNIRITNPRVIRRVPLPPRPYYAPAFGLPKGFTGRKEEMSNLSQWFLIDKEPVYVVEAIGGMGKSSLTWKWLQDEVVDKKNGLAGIIWWSFYQEGFEEFLNNTYEYCLSDYSDNNARKQNKLNEVINILSNNKFLIVLDGFETTLRGYGGMMATYQTLPWWTSWTWWTSRISWTSWMGKPKTEDVYKRQCINIKAEKFLKSITSSQSKVLINTRLFPEVLENLGGVKRFQLNGLSETDTLAFFKNEKIEGTSQEILKAAKVYNYHPLMLKHLSTSLSRLRIRHIKSAYSKRIINAKEPQKILQTSFSVLNKEEKIVATSLSVYRKPFPFEAASVLLKDKPRKESWKLLSELIELGFLSYEEKEQLFDIHPVNKYFLYNQLTNKSKVHQKASVYFENQPEKNLIESIEDLEPVFELFFHLVKAGLLEEAYKLYMQRLQNHLTFKLDYPEHKIALLEELIFDKKLFRKKISLENRSHIIASLGINYNNSLDGVMGMKYLTMAAKLYSNHSKVRFYEIIGLIGSQLSKEGKVNVGSFFLKKRLQVRYNSETQLAHSLNYLGGVMVIQKDGKRRFDKLVDQSRNLFDSKLCLHVRLRISAQHNFQQARLREWDADCYALIDATLTAVEQLCSQELKVSIHNVVWSYTYICKSLLQFRMSKVKLKEGFEILSFTDDRFLSTQSTIVTDVNLIEAVEKYLEKALLLVRKSGQLFLEISVLFLFGRLEWVKVMDGILPIEEGVKKAMAHVSDAYDKAFRSNSHQHLADMHLFYAEVLIAMEESNEEVDIEIETNVQYHLSKTKEYAIDKSVMADLTVFFNDDDPNYDELVDNPLDILAESLMESERLVEKSSKFKANLTPKQRIESGYYYTWKIANDLHKSYVEKK